MMPMNTHPAILAALSKLAPTDRDGLVPGKYEVDEYVTIHLRAEVRVDEDYSQRVTQSARPWALVGFLVRELAQAYRAAGRDGVDLAALVVAAEAAGEDPALKAEIDTIVAGFKAPTWRTCRGAVRVKGECEVVAGSADGVVAA